MNSHRTYWLTLSAVYSVGAGCAHGPWVTGAFAVFAAGTLILGAVSK